MGDFQGRPARPAGLPNETVGQAPEPGYYVVATVEPLVVASETVVGTGVDGQGVAIVGGLIADAVTPVVVADNGLEVITPTEVPSEQPIVAGAGEVAVGTE